MLASNIFHRFVSGSLVGRGGSIEASRKAAPLGLANQARWAIYYTATVPIDHQKDIYLPLGHWRVDFYTYTPEKQQGIEASRKAATKTVE